MWHFHGSYGFRHPDPAYPFGIRVKELPNWTRSVREANVPMSWILVDRSGKRFMNEYPPYVQDTGHRPLELFDPFSASFARVPCFMLVDDEGRKLYRLGDPRFNDVAVRPFKWSDDNLAEVKAGFLKRLDSIEDLAAEIGCPASNLRQTLECWNNACANGSDEDFGRPPKFMVPVKTPPFFMGRMFPIVSNTQGGPVHDAKQRVLNPFGEPIGRLHEAGELGGAWGFLYLGGGNYSEAVIGGRIAARELALLRSWH
jgi:hypothetical protein